MLLQHKRAKHKFNHHRLKFKQQQGVVIVVALFIVALAAGLAYVMISRLDRDTRRTTLLINNVKAELYAKGSILWAVNQLRDNWANQKPNQLVDQMPIKSPVNEVEGFKIVSTIYDMQARYNVNNLVNREAAEDFKRLLQTVVQGISAQTAQDIATAAMDWMASGSQESNFDKYYLELPKPYRSPHQLMASASELQLVKGMTSQIFNALNPYIVALPTPTQINVQTATAPVLVTLSPTLNLDVAKSIINIRTQNPFVTPQIFANLDIIKNHQIPSDKITVISNYFLVETQVTKENQTLALYTLLERATNQQDKSKSVVNILWESRGIW